jgi:hypothetical protein
MIPAWITAISTLVLTLGVFLAYIQLRADHEKCRREKAVDLLMYFNQHLDEANSIARKLVEKLDKMQCEKLFKMEGFTISAELKEYAEGALKNRQSLTPINGEITLDKNQSSSIRWAIVKYLNFIETICVAWHHNVADQDLIKEQLKYVYNPSKNQYALSDFREIAGRGSWPCFDAFVSILKEEYEKRFNTAGKSKIV